MENLIMTVQAPSLVAQFTPLFPLISSLVSSIFSLASDTDLEKNMSDVWTVLLFLSPNSTVHCLTVQTVCL